MCSFFGILENLQRKQLGKKREEAKGLLMNFYKFVSPRPVKNECIIVGYSMKE
jgi:hypothetical protein